jgi:hypothetical protein
MVRDAQEKFLFVADEFNLLIQSAMVSLVPFVEAWAGDSFAHPEVSDPICVARAFLFAASGNEDIELGRISLPDFASARFGKFHVVNSISKHLDDIIAQIIETNYPRLKQSRNVQPVTMRKFMGTLHKAVHVTWSLRSVRRIFRRVNDFLMFHPKILSFQNALPHNSN